VQQYDVHIERQRKKKKRLHRRLTLFSIIVAITFASIITYHINQRVMYAQKQEQYDALQVEMKALENDEKKLDEEVKLLKDEEYVLQIAKTNYFFSEEGEIIFKLPEENPSY